MKKIFAAVFGLLFFVFAAACSAYAPEGKCYVTMLDIGQGDAFLIETPLQNIMIDTGDADHRAELVAQLKTAGVTRLEKIILTHPHADHIGGVAALLKNFPVDEIIDNGILSTSPLYRSYRKADVKLSAAKAGDVIDFGGGVKFRVFNPDSLTVRVVNSKSQRSSPNNESIVGKMTFGDFSILFTGDAEKILEESLVENFQAELKATILKAGHHGSKTSSTAEFVAAVAPDFVLISAGADNKFGHPHAAPLSTFRENFVLPENIFCTRFNGCVRIETDGKNYFLLVDKPDDWVERYTNEKVTVIRLD